MYYKQYKVEEIEEITFKQLKKLRWKNRQTNRNDDNGTAKPNCSV